MPGVYKEKSCGYCGKKHRKRGQYCCQACANSDREPTDKMRNNMRKVAVEYNQTPEAIAQQKMINSGISIEDFAVDIPRIETIDDYDQYIEGFNRAEDW